MLNDNGQERVLRLSMFPCNSVQVPPIEERSLRETSAKFTFKQWVAAVIKLRDLMLIL